MFMYKKPLSATRTKLGYYIQKRQMKSHFSSICVFYIVSLPMYVNLVKL